MELLFVQLFIFLGYMTFILDWFGILPSISDSWYSLPLKYKWTFTLFCWGIGIPMLFYGPLLLFLSGVGLSFVGAATQFKMKESYTKYVHFTGAAVGIFLPVVFLYTLGIWYPLLILTMFGLYLLIFKNIPNKLWWFEVISFLCIITGMYDALPLFYHVGGW